jgi:hypothetical protein
MHPNYFTRHAVSGADDETPLLIVGMPRSGTTLVEQILSSHSQIGARGEILFWGTHGPAWYQDTAENSTAERVPRLAADYRGLLHRLAPGAARVTDKMPFNFLWIGLIRAVFPPARNIHCRRFPIDTACRSTPNTSHRPRTTPAIGGISSFAIANISGCWRIGGRCFRPIAFSKSITRRWWTMPKQADGG